MPIERSRQREIRQPLPTSLDVIREQSLTEKTGTSLTDFNRRQVSAYDTLIQSQKQHTREIDTKQKKEIEALNKRYKERWDHPNYILKRADMEARHTQEVTDLQIEHRFAREELVSTQRTDLQEKRGRHQVDNSSKWPR
jgi:hypothetical protein